MLKKRTICTLLYLHIAVLCLFSQKSLSEYVDPFIGTADDHGQTNPAAVIPFGMIQPGPDTSPIGQSGYNYTANEILGFSQTRISGIGCSGTGGSLRLLPYIQTGNKTEAIDKNSELASPGYYSVKLANGIKTEITTGRTSAIYKFTYPKATKAGISIDFQSALAKFKEENHLIENNSVQGYVEGNTTCDAGTYKLYYYIKIEKDKITALEESGKLFWQFDTKKDETIIVKVSLSSVSEEGANQNMQTELENKSFEQVKFQAAKAWDAILDRVLVETKDEDLRKSFYTRLYHASLTPANIADYSGKVRGSDGEVYYTSGSYYHGWSIWDTFRTKFPLYSILYNDKYKEMIYSLIKLYQQGKPTWGTSTESYPTVRTEHSIIVLLDAMTKKLVDKQMVELIINKILLEAEEIPHESPDQILEQCYDFWAISKIAKNLGLSEIEKQFNTRSKEYRKVWNEKFKVITDKSDIMHGDGLYEGTLWQYRWFVPHDIDWMIGAIGSKKETIAQLDYFFESNLFNMGNQPDIQVPYLYYDLNEPWKTQKQVNSILTKPTENWYGTHKKWERPYIGKIFKTSPDGYLKEMDDDAGTMSAWYVLSSIGLFPVCPGEPYFWISAPLFDSVTIQVLDNKSLHIKTLRQSEEDIYIQSVSFNGIEHKASFMTYDEIMNGGELVIQLGSEPNKRWGTTRPVIN